MVNTMNPKNEIALASDVELRRPGTEPVTLSGGLRPLVARFTADLVGSLDRLKQLADEARLCKDPRAEAALLAKIADVAANVLRLAKPGGALDQTGPTCQEDLPDLSVLSPALHARLDQVMAEVDRELASKGAPSAFGY